MKLTRMVLLAVAGVCLVLLPRSSAKNNDRYAKKYQENKDNDSDNKNNKNQ